MGDQKHLRVKHCKAIKLRNCNNNFNSSSNNDSSNNNGYISQDLYILHGKVVLLFFLNQNDKMAKITQPTFYVGQYYAKFLGPFGEVFWGLSLLKI